MTLANLSISLLLLEQYLRSIRHEGVVEKYASLAYTRFLRAYGRGRYEDAGIWARRLAEACCISMLGNKTEYYVLWEMQSALERDGLLKYHDTPKDVIAAKGDPEVLQVARLVGIPMDQWPLWDDLWLLQKYGNEAAHASSGMLRGGSQADAWVFPSFIRILCVLLAHRKMWHPLVSRL